MKKIITIIACIFFLFGNVFSQTKDEKPLKWYALGMGKIYPNEAKNLNFQFNYSPDFRIYNLTFDYNYHPEYDQKSVALMLGGRYTTSVLHTGISFGSSLNWYTAKKVGFFTSNPHDFELGINWLVMFYVRPIPSILPEIFAGAEYFGQHNSIERLDGVRFCIMISNFQ